MQPAIFSRENPCTKVHIHNAFIGNRGYAPALVIVFCSIAGLNSRKYLKREGFAIEYLKDGSDYIELTPDGETWLTQGLARHLELHPEDRAAVKTGPDKARKTLTKRVVRARGI